MSVPRTASPSSISRNASSKKAAHRRNSWKFRTTTYGLGTEDTLHRVPSIEKINAAIGWAPERTLDEIPADVIASAKADLAAV